MATVYTILDQCAQVQIDALSSLEHIENVILSEKSKLSASVQGAIDTALLTIVSMKNKIIEAKNEIYATKALYSGLTDKSTYKIPVQNMQNLIIRTQSLIMDCGQVVNIWNSIKRSDQLVQYYSDKVASLQSSIDKTNNLLNYVDGIGTTLKDLANIPVEYTENKMMKWLLIGIIALVILAKAGVLGHVGPVVKAFK